MSSPRHNAGSYHRTPRWERESSDGVTWWRIHGWEDYGFQAIFFARQGGFSPSPFDSLNVGHQIGDDPSRVEENRKIVRRFLPPDIAGRILVPRQVHGTRVLPVDAIELEADTSGWAETSEADALMSSGFSWTLGTYHADCLPVYIADPGTGAHAMIHAGWRGLVAGVIPEAIRAMRDEYGVDSRDLVCAVGPHIEPDAYEVGTAVLEPLGDLPWWRDVVSPSSRGRFRLDIGETARRILVDNGVDPRRFVLNAPGSFGNPGDFYSHRRDGLTGRNVALLARSRIDEGGSRRGREQG